MRNFIITFFFFLYVIPSMAQQTVYSYINAPKFYKPIEVNLGEASYIVINGKTNINQFHCSYNQLSTKPMRVVIRQSPDSIYVENAKLKLRTELFDCNNQIMNNDFQELLQSEKFPYIEFEVLRIDALPAEISAVAEENPDVALEVSASITIIGNKQIYSFPVKIIEKSTNGVTLEGVIPLNLTHHNITPPKKLLGLIEVNPVVNIDFFANLEVTEP